MTFLDTVRARRIFAILRAQDGSRLDPVIDCLVESGIHLLEVTLTTPGSLDAVRRAVQRHGSDILVGVGTVLDLDDVRAAEQVGAAFVVSPNTHPPVLAEAQRLGLAALPGAATPTEALTAWRAGASAIKVFPARTLGPHWISDVLAPLPDLPLIPVGGIAADNIPAYLGAGAIGVGVSSPLLGDALASGSLDELHTRARQFLAQAGA